MRKITSWYSVSSPDRSCWPSRGLVNARKFTGNGSVVEGAVQKRLNDVLPLMKQPAFGELIGISGSMVQAIELGQRTLKDDLAWRIFYATGTSVTELMKKKPELRGFDGNFFECTTCQRWKATNQLGKADGLLAVEGMTGPLKAVLTAARRATGGSDLAVRHSYLRWLTETVREFGLRSEINSMRWRGEFPVFDPSFLDLTLGSKELETKDPWLGSYRSTIPEPDSIPWTEGFRPPERMLKALKLPDGNKSGTMVK